GGTGRAEARGRDEARRELVLPSPRDGAAPAAVALQGQHGVVAHAQVVDDALVLAVLTRVGDALLQRGTGGAEAAGSARDGDRARLGPVGTREQPGQLGAARAEQAGQPDDLARLDRQRRRFDGALAA